MTINLPRARHCLESFEFKKLFVEELGWANARGRAIRLEVDAAAYPLQPIAELGGMRVFVCDTEEMPPVAVRRQVEKQALDLAHEHIVIFVDAAHTKAVWQWVKRADGQSARAREHTYHQGTPGDSLLQKLNGIAFTLDELDDAGEAASVEVTGRVARSFDVERVTKRFYDEFKDEHAHFLKFIRGVEAVADRQWYASVMLNRLMFIYFIQKKAFLDGDPDYLRHKLEQSQARGADRYYRDFLTTLFFEGFAQEEKDRSAETRRRLGQIPYLNGGLFTPHKLETRYGRAIQIPDAVFAKLFEFFDRYQWHLDDRRLRADNEINPDVLGYIFEKYINQKQMGAYYTKEDITGYNCRNTILPFLLDKLGTLRYAAVHPLPLLDLEPYIYPAVKQAEYLPTETEREHTARLARLAGLRADFKAGKIAAVNDLITYNLDSERFVQDWLRGLTDPLTLRAFYFECLRRLTVLDPTVGSGAFLFAAMNILEPLYEICLDKMAALGGPKYPDFGAELARMAEHPNRCYFIFKSIIVNNLYGVDLMEEAVEICKLRLFLKLVAQVDDVARIEPLPDIDFDIRAGNTLVGYASLAEVEQAATRSLFNTNLPQRIKEADLALRAFRDLQTQMGIGAKALAKAKSDTQAKLAEIEAELNEALRVEYGAKNPDKFVESHHPFHWYVEFNQIMQEGGFDVIVGNPPYVEYGQVRKEYTALGYQTESCGNLFAFVGERCFRLSKSNGRIGIIVPISSISTPRMDDLMNLLASEAGQLHVSNYAVRPGKLFVGVDMNLTILLINRGQEKPNSLFSTRYQRWAQQYRPFLFENIEYCKSEYRQQLSCIPKFGNGADLKVWKKILRFEPFAQLPIRAGSGTTIYYHSGGRYFRKCLLEALSVEYKPLEVAKGTEYQVVALLSSSLYYWFWLCTSDCYHVTKPDIANFNVPPTLSSDSTLKRLGKRLLDDLWQNSHEVNLFLSIEN